MKELLGKHIVLIVENLSVPFDRRVWREANALINVGYSVSVISPKGQGQDSESKITINGVDIYRYSLPLEQSSKWGYVLEYLKAFFNTFFILLKILRKGRVHAIHVANPPDIFFPLGWIKRFLGYKFIFDQHDLSPETFKYKFRAEDSHLVYRLLLWCEKQTYRVSDHIVSTNQSLREFAIKRGKKKENDITIVRNGPDKFFQPQTPNLKLKKGKKYLAAYIGVMGKQDGVEYIIEAANYLINHKRFKSIHFILIGYGDEFIHHKKLVEKYHLNDFIDMPGRIPDAEVLEILSTADVCLAPDPKNGLNEYHTMNKIMDYMRIGKPIVSFDLLESRYSAENAAVYIENNNSHAFANAIVSLLLDPVKSNRMAEFGKLKVENQLKWEISVKNLLNVYDNIFNK